MAPGATVKLGVVRAGAEKTLSLTLGELPNQREAPCGYKSAAREEQQNEAAARTVADASGSEPGVVVAEVDPSGPPPISASRPAT